MRERVGSIVNRKSRVAKGKVTWWARITYTDPVTGKRHDRQRRAESKSNAKDLVQDLIAEVDKTGGRPLAKEHMTFVDLATYYEEEYLKPAEYVDVRKVAGVSPRGLRSGFWLQGLRVPLLTCRFHRSFARSARRFPQTASAREPPSPAVPERRPQE